MKMMTGSERSKREVRNGFRGYVTYLQLFSGSISNYFNFGQFGPKDMNNFTRNGAYKLQNYILPFSDTFVLKDISLPKCLDCLFTPLSLNKNVIRRRKMDSYV